jgi:hypothetical protein
VAHCLSVHWRALVAGLPSVKELVFGGAVLADALLGRRWLNRSLHPAAVFCCVGIITPNGEHKVNTKR